MRHLEDVVALCSVVASVAAVVEAMAEAGARTMVRNSLRIAPSASCVERRGIQC
jgi:hypothetical protein